MSTSSTRGNLALPKVQTRKAFMDAHYERIRPPRSLPDDAESAAGRPPDLKTYLIENDSPLMQKFNTEKFYVSVDQTGLDDIKILTLTDMQDSDSRLQFYLDKSDERFLVFHTFELAKHVNPAMENLVSTSTIDLDNAWLSTGMLKSISNELGNVECGYEVRHTDYFQPEPNGDDAIKPDTYSNISVSGNQSDKIFRLLRRDKDISQLLSYSKVIIGRGTKNSGVIDDLYYYGRFNVVKGDSVDDHISLVGMVKNKYIDLIRGIEECSIYGDRDTRTVMGGPFEFHFNRSITDWDHFLRRMFNSKAPFRVWGIKNEISENYYQILGVDVHTGHPFDVEMTDSLLRVYLPKGSCGNLVARLFVNFQMFFDSQVKCPALGS